MPVMAAHANACQLHCCMHRCVNANDTAAAEVACNCCCAHNCHYVKMYILRKFDFSIQYCYTATIDQQAGTAATLCNSGGSNRKYNRHTEINSNI